MPTDRFADLPAILERLPEAKRAELGWVRSSWPDGSGEWSIRGHPPHNATLSDHYAVLAVVEGELVTRGLELGRGDKEWSWVDWQGIAATGEEAYYTSPCRFTAAAAAYLEVCNADH